MKSKGTWAEKSRDEKRKAEVGRDLAVEKALRTRRSIQDGVGVLQARWLEKPEPFEDKELLALQLIGDANFLVWEFERCWKGLATGEAPFLLRAVLATFEVRPSLLAEPGWVRSLAGLTTLLWIRDPETWAPRGAKAPEAMFRSLAWHLLGRYPTPAFLYTGMRSLVRGKEHGSTAVVLERTPFHLFAHVAQGKSVMEAIKLGLLPVPFTRKMAHLFLRAPATCTVYDAVRRAQIRAMAAEAELGQHSDRLVQAISASFLGQAWQGTAEVFWATVLQWFVNQSMLDPAQVRPLLDYIQHRRGLDAVFIMKGRTPMALLRDMEQWHADLAKTKKVQGNKDPFQPSGITGGVWIFKGKNDGAPKEQWTVAEILTPGDLLTEGREMKHCVGSYAGSIRSGRTSVWSVRKGWQGQFGERILTLEVVNATRRLVQARGLRNRLVGSGKETTVVQQWLGEAGLSMGNVL